MNRCDKCERIFKNVGAYSRHKKSCNLTKVDLQNILDRYLKGETLRELSNEYPHCTVLFVTKGKRRSISKANELAHKKYPENYKHSNASKAKIRKARLKYMEDNPQSAAWRRSTMSYPEKVFQQLVEKNELSKQYDIVYEYSIFPFYIDFAFVNVKLAVEIDGSQHYTMKSKIDRDKRKDDLLISKGWKIYRIPAFKIQNEFKNIEKLFLAYLSSIDIQPKIFDFKDDIIRHHQIKERRKKEKRKQWQETLNDREKVKQYREQLLLNSNIDFSKFGWVKQAGILLDITPQKTTLWIRRNLPDFYKNCYHK